MENVSRFGVSMEPELLADFDRMVERKGYPNRSEAIRDLVRDSLVKDRVETGEGSVVGTLTLVYDHHASGVNNKLLDIQHDSHSSIISQLHIHLDHHNCLEVLIIRGKAKDVKGLADRIRAVKGVKNGDLVITAGD